MRLDSLFGNGLHLYLSKSSLLDHSIELVLGKPQPLITIKFTGFFKLMLFQVEDDQLTVLLENSKGFESSQVIIVCP